MRITDTDFSVFGLFCETAGNVYLFICGFVWLFFYFLDVVFHVLGAFGSYLAWGFYGFLDLVYLGTAIPDLV